MKTPLRCAHLPLPLLLGLTACSHGNGEGGGGGGGNNNGGDSASSGGDTGEPWELPADCAAEQEGLYEVLEGEGAPYWVSGMGGAEGSVPTLLYLPGGGGSREGAQLGFLRFFGEHHDFITRYRVLAPYSETNAFPEEYTRALAVVAEAQRCWRVGTVHLVGHSAGGNAAAALMAEDTTPWRSLSLAPGSFASSVSDADFSAMFADHAVYLGVGEQDTGGWYEYTADLAAHLEALGVTVTLDVWAGQGHVPDPKFDPAVLHSFLDAH